MSVEQVLRSWHETATGEMADALWALLRSDRSRLAFWEGPALPNGQVEAQDRPDDAVGAAVTAASGDPLVRVCIGWAQTEEGIVGHAWLVGPEGIADPAREQLGAIGYLGVALRDVERSRWTPSGPLIDLAATPDARNFVG